jgi:DNA repair photolyase
MATSPILRSTPSMLRRRRNLVEQTTLFPPAARPGNNEPRELAPSPTPVASRETEQAPELVGIARLAASSPRAEAKRGTEYFLLPVRSILNHCEPKHVPFEWTINPYRGCEFGCRYCYARYTHEYMRLDGDDFEKKIFVKQNTGPLCSRDLAEGKAWGQHIAIGAATDPYQPAEKEFGATRAILEKMAEREGLSVSITTKSNQIVRDLELLQRIAQRSSISVNMTITTLRPRLARMLEPRAPHPSLRLEAVRKLREAGIAVGVFAMPVIPGLTDRRTDLDALAAKAKEVGAQWFCSRVLYLMPASWKTFFAFLEEKFPKLATRYRDIYRGYGEAPEKYRREISALTNELRQKYKLGARPVAPAAPPKSAQLDLCWNAPHPGDVHAAK